MPGDGWQLKRTFPLLHGDYDTRPSIHNAFPQRSNVVIHIISILRAWIYIGGLLQNGSYHGQVGLEVGPDSLRDISEALQDCRLELVTQCSALLRISSVPGMKGS